jgi:hypothetical protein
VSSSAGSGVDTARVVDHVQECEQFFVAWRVGAVRWRGEDLRASAQVSTLRADLCQVAGAPLGGQLLARSAPKSASAVATVTSLSAAQSTRRTARILRLRASWYETVLS